MKTLLAITASILAATTLSQPASGKSSITYCGVVKEPKFGAKASIRLYPSDDKERTVGILYCDVKGTCTPALHLDAADLISIQLVAVTLLVVQTKSLADDGLALSIAFSFLGADHRNRVWLKEPTPVSDDYIFPPSEVLHFDEQKCVEPPHPPVSTAEP